MDESFAKHKCGSLRAGAQLLRSCFFRQSPKPTMRFADRQLKKLPSSPGGLGSALSLPVDPRFGVGCAHLFNSTGRPMHKRRKTRAAAIPFTTNEKAINAANQGCWLLA
jgi:hypothetical protein